MKTVVPYTKDKEAWWKAILTTVMVNRGWAETDAQRVIANVPPTDWAMIASLPAVAKIDHLAQLVDSYEKAQRFAAA